MPDGPLFYPPTLITNVQTTSTVVQEEIFGPVIAAMSFRTAKEAIALANNTRYGLAASVWTESMPLAMECALSIKAGTVWVNAHNLFDAAAGFGGYVVQHMSLTLLVVSLLRSHCTKLWLRF
jgi:aldehyde dehydrogenase (NAD+)